MKPLATKLLSSLLLAGCLLAAQPALASADFLSQADVRSFIDSINKEYGIDRAELERILGDVRYSATALRLTTPIPSSAPSPARSYTRYRESGLGPEVISAGSRFWSLLG